MSKGEGITIFCELPEGYWEGQMNYDWTKTAVLTIVQALAGVQ